MGEFTQNLLKLTEFPFSYSLIGLIALILGQGINLGELSFAKLGPMLILMDNEIPSQPSNVQKTIWFKPFS